MRELEEFEEEARRNAQNILMLLRKNSQPPAWTTVVPIKALTTLTLIIARTETLNRVIQCAIKLQT